jgi:dynein heavy chain
MPASFDIVQKESVAIFNSEKRNIYTTPKSFLELIKLYKNKLGIKRSGIEDNRDRYITGVKLLEDIQTTVEELNKVLVVKRVEVEEKKANAESIEAVVKVEKENVEKESALANVELEKASTLKEFIAEKKSTIEGKIAVAMPKVAETLKKLDNLDKKQVEFIKSLASPDEKIKQTIYVLMHLFTDVPLNASVKGNKGKIDLNWNAAKVLIKEPAKFVVDMKTFGSELVRNSQVPQPNFNKAKKLIEDEGLTFDVLKPKSEAAATFIEFAANIIEFNEVIKLVGPMEAELADLSVKLAAANESARISQNQVDTLNAKLKELIDK